MSESISGLVEFDVSMEAIEAQIMVVSHRDIPCITDHGIWGEFISREVYAHTKPQYAQMEAWIGLFQPGVSMWPIKYPISFRAIFRFERLVMRSSLAANNV